MVSAKGIFDGERGGEGVLSEAEAGGREGCEEEVGRRGLGGVGGVRGDGDGLEES